MVSEWYLQMKHIWNFFEIATNLQQKYVKIK